MSSIYGYIYVVFYFLTLYIITINTRTINEINSIDLIVDEYSNSYDPNIEIIIKNYQHRFEHSINLKKLRWALQHRYNKAYCDFCNLVIPVVRFILKNEKKPNNFFE